MSVWNKSANTTCICNGRSRTRSRSETSKVVVYQIRSVALRGHSTYFSTMSTLSIRNCGRAFLGQDHHNLIHVGRPSNDDGGRDGLMDEGTEYNVSITEHMYGVVSDPRSLMKLPICSLLVRRSNATILFFLSSLVRSILLYGVLSFVSDLNGVVCPL